VTLTLNGRRRRTTLDDHGQYPAIEPPGLALAPRLENHYRVQNPRYSVRQVVDHAHRSFAERSAPFASGPLGEYALSIWPKAQSEQAESAAEPTAGAWELPAAEKSETGLRAW